MIPTVDPTLYQELYDHAVSEYPKEACGLIIDGEIKNLQVSGQYVPITNVSETPNDNFKMSVHDVQPYLGRITAYSHSHPDGESAPSEADMVGQMNTAKPWIITATNGTNCIAPFAFGDELGDIPLEDRIFRHGVTDCFDSIRDYYKQKREIILPNFAREWGWWDAGESGANFYQTKFEKAGFRKIEANSPVEVIKLIKPHDVFVLSMRSAVANHGGVYLGDGLIYHHLGSVTAGPYSPRHRSTIESAMRWMDYRPTILRYGSNEDC